MIKSREDLRFYLEADKFALNRSQTRPTIVDWVWRYQILLRRVEFHEQLRRSPWRWIVVNLLKYRKSRLGAFLGFDIPSNTFGPGLRINHFGNLIVNGGAKIDMWCDVHQGVNIGTNNSPDGTPLVPEIGRNVWIGPGAKIFGGIQVGSGVVIGANAVVNSDIPAHSTCLGIPAKVVKHHGTESMDIAASPRRMDEFFRLHPEWAHRKPSLGS